MVYSYCGAFLGFGSLGPGVSICSKLCAVCARRAVDAASRAFFAYEVEALADRFGVPMADVFHVLAREFGP